MAALRDPREPWIIIAAASAATIRARAVQEAVVALPVPSPVASTPGQCNSSNRRQPCTITSSSSNNSSSSSSNSNSNTCNSSSRRMHTSNMLPPWLPPTSSSNNNNSNNNNNSVSSVEHVASAVAAAVIVNEHQNHLNSLKARFQPSSSGRKSPFLGFICKANGKSTSNSKEIICPDDKYKEEGDIWNVEAQTAFLGPNLWDKTLPYDADLKVTQYADLDEFLSENNIPDGLPGTHLGHSSGLGHRSDSLGHAAGLSLGLGHITTKRERSPSPSDCISPDTLNPPSPAESTFSFASSGRDFDPRTRAFSDEELKPQPMIKKSRKQFVPDELKDDKYWARRRKNNIAAKRSRDARRQKENQIAMRARYLEKENATLHQEVEQLKQENMDLRARLSKFQDV
ncbi:hepatic leukemia factor isoform X10 [Drosophila guanche]|uniref:hepatic leukemia factor isoform X10 n=1 Tax=Drosophila guanche TaxID=7266 RepID=UPI001471ADAA|nr:hepatic leukemia factor isoform X10 [Drosophila guanche]